MQDPIQDVNDAAGAMPQDDELEALRGELEQLKAQSLLERADLENQRKRIAREIDSARKFANERLLGELLPVIDNLERGLAADKGEASGLHAGVELTLKELLRVVTASGLVIVDPLGEKFDPERHQAMSMVESAGHESNQVVAVLQKGYLLNERLLRPALVNVAQ